jgi:hypothetical protein
MGSGLAPNRPARCLLSFLVGRQVDRCDGEPRFEKAAHKSPCLHLDVMFRNSRRSNRPPHYLAKEPAPGLASGPGPGFGPGPGAPPSPAAGPDPNGVWLLPGVDGDPTPISVPMPYGCPVSGTCRFGSAHEVISRNTMPVASKHHNSFITPLPSHARRVLNGFQSMSQA